MYKILKPFEKGLFTDLVFKGVPKKLNTVTQEELREVFDYSAETGIFRWKTQPKYGSVKVGDIAGYLNKAKGYWYIKYQGKKYSTHRLDWLYIHGETPKEMIDHIDGNPLNNRISNLREATSFENQKNRAKNLNGTSRFKGVTWHKRDCKWVAQIGLGGKRVHLGYHDTEEDASNAYETAALRHHGKFYRDTSKVLNE
jgi:hypothetical protein